MLNKSLYVITHKKVKNIFPKDRKIMLVGAKNKIVPNDYFSDFSENKANISEKNANYCELTGLYYFYKNDKDAEVFGLEHYRRLFTKRKYYLFRYPFLKSKDIDKILKNNDIIVPTKVTLSKTVYEQYAEEHIIEDLNSVVNIIREKYPDYIESCEKILSGNSVYFCNMFIAKREIIEKYCSWLFDILFELEKQINLSNRDDFQKRVFGFLSERMFTIWLDKNSDIKRFECHIEFIDSSPFMNMVKKVIKKLKKLLNKK